MQIILIVYNGACMRGIITKQIIAIPSEELKWEKIKYDTC